MTDRALQTEARRLEVVTLIAFILLVVALVGRYLLLPLVGALREAVPASPEFYDIVGRAVVQALPAFALLGAVDATRKLFSRLARGEMFGDSVGRGVRGVGASLIWAALVAALIVPWLTAWLDGRYGFGGIHLDPTTIVLGVVGAAMLLLGRLLKRAGALQSELESYV